MAKRRSRGEGGVHYSESRQRWVATAQLGFLPNGKRIVKTATGRTKTEAKARLSELLREREQGINESARATVAMALQDWLEYGLSGRDQNTVTTCRILAERHIIPELGPRRLAALSSEDVDLWLKRKAESLSRSTLQRLLSILRRALARQVARDRLRRNVALHCEIPAGRPGRPSKALSLEQALKLLAAAQGTPMEAYITVSLLTGARTEELRALSWDHIDLDGDPAAERPVPPTIQLWRSVREGGDTKTRRSRRTLTLPQRAVDALRRHKEQQRAVLGRDWQEERLVFTSSTGTPLDPRNVRRSLRAVLEAAGLDPKSWAPRELRHSFVSILSDSGVPIEDIARLVGHRGTVVTEAVYRKQLRPVLTSGAEAWDRLLESQQESPTSPAEDAQGRPHTGPESDP
jgi:integrase